MLVQARPTPGTRPAAILIVTTPRSINASFMVHGFQTLCPQRLLSQSIVEGMVQTPITAYLTKRNALNSTAAESIRLGTVATQGITKSTNFATSLDRDKDAASMLSGISSRREQNIGAATSNPKVPSNAQITTITSEYLPQFRRMTSLLLPIPYPDRFFKEIIEDEIASNISLIALWSDGTASKPKVVAGIRCRLLCTNPSKSPALNDNEPSLYISTITTLAPYRRHGLASALLDEVTSRASQKYGIHTVSAHVWEANEEGRQWYAKQGFSETGFENEYYRRLRPNGAWIVERNVRSRSGSKTVELRKATPATDLSKGA